MRIVIDRNRYRDFCDNLPEAPSIFQRAERIALPFVVLAEEQTIFHYARLFLQLRTQGTMIPVHDIWFAALAVQDNLFLFSRGRHFEHLPQIPKL